MNPLIVAKLMRIAIKGLNHPTTKKIAKRLIGQVKKGDSQKAINSAESIISKAKKVVGKQKRRAQGAVKSILTEEKQFNPNLGLRKELYYNPHTQTAGEGIFTQMRKTPMLDLDFKGASHYARNTVHENKFQALKALEKYLKTPSGKKNLFATYDTPGGIRLFDLTRRRTPKKYYNPTGNPGGSESGLLNLKLGGDPDYAFFNLKRGNYAARISPKPGRDNDFIARFVNYLGEGTPNPKNLRDVKFHDDLVKIMRKQSSESEISLGGLLDFL